MTHQISFEPGVMLEAHGLGVLICGPPGIGKSLLALEMVLRGHKLIADDLTEFHQLRGRPVGRCPAESRGFLVLRGLGVVNIERLYGPGSVSDGARLSLILDLRPLDSTAAPADPFPLEPDHRRVLGTDIPRVTIHVSPGVPPVALAETALRDQRLRRSGYDAAAELSRRVARRLGSQSGLAETL